MCKRCTENLLIMAYHFSAAVFPANTGILLIYKQLEDACMHSNDMKK